MFSLSDSQRAVARDARRLLAGQIELAREAPSTGPIAAVIATPFGRGYLLGTIDALCQTHGAPFDAVALAIFGALLDEVCGRDATGERDAALESLKTPDEKFDLGYSYGGNEALGWACGACVPSALVLMARKK